MPYIIDASDPLRPCLRRGNSRHGKKNRLESGQGKKGKTGMGRIIKAIFILAVVAFAGLTGYAYLTDLSPTQAEVSKPVTLNAD